MLKLKTFDIKDRSTSQMFFINALAWQRSDLIFLYETQIVFSKDSKDHHKTIPQVYFKKSIMNLTLA